MSKKKEKYWIKGGKYVKLKYGGPRMMVMRVEQNRSKGPDGKWRYTVLGVKCCWVDDFGEERKGMFHTHELVPA